MKLSNVQRKLRYGEDDNLPIRGDGLVLLVFGVRLVATFNVGVLPTLRFITTVVPRQTTLVLELLLVVPECIAQGPIAESS